MNGTTTYRLGIDWVSVNCGTSSCIRRKKHGISTIAELLCSSVRRLRPSRGNGIAVIEGSPIRYNMAWYGKALGYDFDRPFLLQIWF